MLSMDANQFIKHIQAQSGLTYAQIAELLTQKTGKKYSRQSLYARVRRKSLKFEEANLIAQIVNAKIGLKFD